MRRHWPAAEHGLRVLYPATADQLVADLAARVTRHVNSRPPHLAQRDIEREAEPDWFQHSDVAGYVAYADRFADTLQGVGQQLDYLEELGITYLHLMPLLRPRAGENDGGYAVVAYDEVDPRLGTMDDLRRLADDLHERRMSLCVDLVLNHTAAEHPWARKARAGDERYRGYYFFSPDREFPDRMEATLREVFPAFAPGNFTWLPDAEQWVWTTFHEFQWDLDWSNPEVFTEMFDVMLGLADVGIDVLRLDAVPFMWKREGTDCENLPEAHLLLRTLRALMAIAAPATIFKAEAIVSPDQLTPYLGSAVPPRRECELAYHNQLMVLLWNSLATGEARLMTNSLQSMAPIPSTSSWVTYVRCHDDIGWAITDEAAAACGWDGFSHRRFLSDFYAGDYPMSFARGEVFQSNPATGDRRISGSTASLCGIQAALESGDDAALELACRRFELMYAAICLHGGIPLVYMGDEIGLLNDRSYLDDPSTADDNRWTHRPHMDWALAAQRHEPGTVQARLFGQLQSLLSDRAALPALHGESAPQVITPGDPALLVLLRDDSVRGAAAMVANFATGPRTFDVASLGHRCARVVRGTGARLVSGRVRLEALGYVWLELEPTPD